MDDQLYIEAEFNNEFEPFFAHHGILRTRIIAYSRHLVTRTLTRRQHAEICYLEQNDLLHSLYIYVFYPVIRSLATFYTLCKHCEHYGDQMGVT